MRQFMIAPLARAVWRPGSRCAPGLIREGPGSGLILERWDHRYFEPCARLIQLAYANHVDGEINDQYRSESGALRFLKNIIILPGCGQFQPEASFVLRELHANHLAGVVLNSRVSTGVGHTTQICAMPGYQGRGLGRLPHGNASLHALRVRGYTTRCTYRNLGKRSEPSALYERLGFATVKKFAARRVDGVLTFEILNLKFRFQIPEFETLSQASFEASIFKFRRRVRSRRLRESRF